MTVIDRVIGVIAVVVAIGIGSAHGQQAAYPPQIALEELQQRIGACSPEHPRLLTSRRELAELPKTLDRDPLRRQLADLIVRQADSLDDVAPVERKLVGKRLLYESRRCLQRVLTLATAYHLTGETRYVERCRKEMLAAARFSDWNPSHYLDVAEMTAALAIGYDWLYDELDDATRQEIRTAIVEKGVKLSFDPRHNGWQRLENNWGQVCHGGMTLGALAVLEDEPELAARTVQNALQNVVNAMSVYAPRGSYPEGPSYWGYGTSYNVLLIGALESALGSDFGLSHAPGFDDTGAFPALACGPSGQYFNFADGSAQRTAEPILFWFASRYRRPDWLRGERELWQKQVSAPRFGSLIASDRFIPLTLLWMNDSVAPTEIRMPLDWNGAGTVPIAIHRSSWIDPNATFVGLKGGSPSASHGQMDSGSFVLDSDGVRWAVDLGREDYEPIERRNMNLWSNAQDSDRWKIFRLSNQGNNTLVIDGKLQVARGDAPIVEFSDASGQSYSIVDLSQVYQGQAETVRRGIKLLPTHEVLIQDELTGLRPGSRVRWGMITAAESPGLGSRQITLRQAGKQLQLRLVSPSADGWSQVDTATPRNEWDSPNAGTQMVAVEAVAPESGELTIAVVATPGSCGDPTADGLRIEALKNWRPSASER